MLGRSDRRRTVPLWSRLPPLRKRLLELRAWLAAALAAPIRPISSVRAGEYQAKAAFLYNFVKLVDWPPRSLPSGGLTVCILGDDPFGDDIKVIASKPVGSTKLQVRRVSVEEAAGCQVLFISASEAPRLDDVLDAVRGRPVLTVGDVPAFADRGAVISFHVEQNKVRFSINVDAARRNGLTISSRLLRLARITRDQCGANSQVLPARFQGPSDRPQAAACGPDRGGTP